MGLKYQSGEEIREGDRVTYAGYEGTIELVVEGGDPENTWYFENVGEGVLIAEPKLFGRVYLTAPHDRKDLILLARGTAGAATTRDGSDDGRH